MCQLIRWYNDKVDNKSINYSHYNLRYIGTYCFHLTMYTVHIVCMGYMDGGIPNIIWLGGNHIF